MEYILVENDASKIPSEMKVMGIYKNIKDVPFVKNTILVIKKT